MCVVEATRSQITICLALRIYQFLPRTRYTHTTTGRQRLHKLPAGIAICFKKSGVCWARRRRRQITKRRARRRWQNSACRRRRFVRMHDLKIITTIRRRINLAFVTLCVLQVDYAYSAELRCGAGCISHPSQWWTSAPLSLPLSPSPPHPDTHAYTHTRTLTPHTRHTLTHTHETRRRWGASRPDGSHLSSATHPSRPSPHLVWLILWLRTTNKLLYDSRFLTHTRKRSGNLSVVVICILTEVRMRDDFCPANSTE